MPFFDRHWWLRVVAIAAVVLVFLAFVTFQIRLTFSLMESPYIPSTPWWLIALGIASYAFFIFTVPISWLRAALVARRRAISRRVAITGEVDRVPPSTIRVDTSYAADLAHDPLVIAWRWSRGRRRAQVIFLLLYGAILLALPFLPLPPPFSPLVPYDSPSSSVPLPLAYPFAFLGAFSVLFALVVLVHGLITRNRPARPRIIFTADGVQEYLRFGRRRALRWEEARLLEARYDAFPLQQYILYGPRGRFVQWTDYLPSGAAFMQRSALTPDGITQEEMAIRLQSALGTVAARTGLSPRAFDPRLREPAPAAKQGLLRRIGAVIVASVAIAFLAPIFIALLGFPLSLGVYVLIRQPFSEPLFNIASGAALASGGALLVLWLLVELVYALVQSRFASAKPLPVEEPPDFTDIHQEYELVLPQPWRQVALSFLIPLLLTCGCAIGIIGQNVAPRAPSSDVSASSATSTVMLLIGLLGLISAALFLGRLRDGVRTIKRIRADAQGLHFSHGRIAYDLQWGQIDAFHVRVAKGRSISYSAKAEIARKSIEWNATARTGKPSAGNAPLTAATLAALIEQRTGIAPTQVDGLGKPTPPQQA
jgi:hypothetical protein